MKKVTFEKKNIIVLLFDFLKFLPDFSKRNIILGG